MSAAVDWDDEDYWYTPDLVKRVWKPVVGAPSMRVSNKGEVQKRMDGGWVDSQMWVYRDRPLEFHMPYDPATQRCQRTQVDRTVLAAFVGPPPDAVRTWAVHVDGNKRNSRVENLRWGDRGEEARLAWVEEYLFLRSCGVATHELVGRLGPSVEGVVRRVSRYQCWVPVGEERAFAASFERAIGTAGARFTVSSVVKVVGCSAGLARQMIGYAVGAGKLVQVSGATGGAGSGCVYEAMGGLPTPIWGQGRRFRVVVS